MGEAFDVRTAATRDQARSAMVKLDPVPQLALVDLGLPPTTHSPEEGFALIGELLTINPTMKILVLSGQSDRANVQHALSLGAIEGVAHLAR